MTGFSRRRFSAGALLCGPLNASLFLEALRQLLESVAPLSAEAWADFAGLFRPVDLAKRAYFTRAGEPVRDVVFVESGVLRVFVTAPDGTEYTKTFFSEGHLLALYHALISGGPSYLSVQALTPAQLQVAPYAAVEALYDRHPALERVARRLAEQLFVVKEQREIDLVLLDAAARYAKLQREHPGLEQRVAQHYIASNLGITPTQLSRIRARQR